jgi:hypothetical protein
MRDQLGWSTREEIARDAQVGSQIVEPVEAR